MPISDRVGLDTSGYAPTQAQPAPNNPEQNLLPPRDSMQRFTAPYLPNIFPSSDNLTGFHLGGKIPQWRIPVPPITGAGSGSGGTVSNNTTVISSSSSTVSVLPKAQTASITTSTISPGSIFTGVASMAKSFEVQFISVTQPARVRIYSTASSQVSDLTRSLLVGYGYGTGQGLIGDVELDTAPIVWQCTPTMLGANGDSPQSTAAYVSVTNLGMASAAITVSLTFVPLQS